MVSLIILLIISSIISPLIILWVIILIPSVGLNFKKIISELFRLMTSVSNLSSLFLLIPLTIQGFRLELPLLLVVIRVLPNVSAGQSLGLVVSDCFKFPGPARASESPAARLVHAATGSGGPARLLTSRDSGSERVTYSDPAARVCLGPAAWPRKDSWTVFQVQVLLVSVASATIARCFVCSSGNLTWILEPLDNFRVLGIPRDKII